MWELSSSSHVLNFLYSIALGFIFDLLYDIFKSVRLTVKCSDISVFIQDVLYFAVISVLSFCFFLCFTYGEIRFYILIGFILGFAVSYLTLSKIVIPFLSFIIRIIIKISGYLDWIFNALYKFFTRISKKVKKFLKNALKSAKNS